MTVKSWTESTLLLWLAIVWSDRNPKNSVFVEVVLLLLRWFMQGGGGGDNSKLIGWEKKGMEDKWRELKRVLVEIEQNCLFVMLFLRIRRRAEEESIDEFWLRYWRIVESEGNNTERGRLCLHANWCGLTRVGKLFCHVGRRGGLETSERGA